MLNFMKYIFYIYYCDHLNFLLYTVLVVYTDFQNFDLALSSWNNFILVLFNVLKRLDFLIFC